METGTIRGLAPVKYRIDRAASRFTVQAFASGMLAAFGHNPRIGIIDYDAEIQFVPQTYEKAILKMELRTKAMEVLSDMKDDDRKKLEQAMFEDILEADRFPVAVYESRDVKVVKPDREQMRARCAGDLTFHGVTQSQFVEARFTDMGSLLRIAGEFSLRQSDYGIRPFSFAGGAMRLKDVVSFSFDMVARMEE